MVFLNKNPKPMNTRYQLLELLADGKFHSGTALGSSLGISRSAVWKSLRRLEQIGMELDSVRGKGYRLRRPLELLDESRIRSQLDEQQADWLERLELHTELESTNSHLLQSRGLIGVNRSFACLTESQSGGRGRRGRHWQSPFGRNLYLSVGWCYQSTPTQLSALSLATAVVTLRALQSFGIGGIGLKWPNDLLWNDRKLAGILLEMSGEAGGSCHVVVGIGINLDMSDQQGAAIDRPWVDLARIESGAEVSRNLLAGTLLNDLLALLQSYPQAGFEPWMADWLANDGWMGRRVLLEQGNQSLVGINRGVDAQGALLLEINGQTQSCMAGEVSLRGVE